MNFHTHIYVLVTGNIAATGGDDNTRLAFKSCAPFTEWITHINDEHIDRADNLDIMVLMFNLIKHRDNHSDTLECLSQFKRDELPVTDAGNLGSISLDNSKSFKCKSSFLNH